MNIQPNGVLVLGTGYVAGAYMRALHHLGMRPLILSRSWVDYTDVTDFNRFVRLTKPQLVINAAGYGQTVDDCEMNKEKAYAALVALPRMLGQVCKEHDVPMIQISSGCIFDGRGPFTEESVPNNIGQFYAQCKINAEMELASTGVRAWIFRIRMPFNHLSHPRNLLTKLSQYERILDGFNSVTFLDEFAMRSYQLVQKDVSPGVYNAACSLPIQTAHIAGLLYNAGLRKRKVDLVSEEEFLVMNSGHVHRSAAVLDVSKFEKAYGTPFGDALGSIKWAIENFNFKLAS